MKEISLVLMSIHHFHGIEALPNYLQAQKLPMEIPTTQYRLY